jgi:hypothetical protein
MSPKVLSNALGLLGAVSGGVAGFVVFGFLLRINLYGLILPGTLAGLGCSLLARHRSLPRGIACGALGLLLGLLAEWYNFPFVGDSAYDAFREHLSKLGEDFGSHAGAALTAGLQSFGSFVTRLGELVRGVYAYAMLALGTVLAFWWGQTPQFGDRLAARGKPTPGPTEVG